MNAASEDDGTAEELRDKDAKRRRRRAKDSSSKGTKKSRKTGAEGADGEAAAKKADPYEVAVVEYNEAFTLMSDKGMSLLRQRERSTDLIELIEQMVNSIANTPKSFDADIAEITMQRAEFLAAEEFGRRELEAARASATSAGAGVVAGAAVASMAPTAALWVATTFGTASTGTAISTLSGAAASKAALAWLGGGALAAGGGGTAAGSALLALAGPIGWTVAGATLLASVALYTNKKFKNRKEKNRALTALKSNIAQVRDVDAQLKGILERTVSLRVQLHQRFGESLELYGRDFLSLSADQQLQLGALVNNTKACAVLLGERVSKGSDEE